MTYEEFDGVKNMGENLHPDIYRTLSGLIPPDSRPLVVVPLSRGRVQNHGKRYFGPYANKRMESSKPLAGWGCKDNSYRAAPSHDVIVPSDAKNQW
jgi:hypothetical protein